MHDVIIIGAGVTGCSIARELARYKLDICVLEKCEDVCCGTSKANSAIIHAGYDAKSGSKKARFNVEGCKMMDSLSKQLDFHFRRNGSLVVMFEGEDRTRLEELFKRGVENGVEGLRIVEKEELHKLEPNIAEDAIAALYAPDAGIVCPFGMTVAYAENACANGVHFEFNTEVEKIERIDDHYYLNCSKRFHSGREKTVHEAAAVINAAGVYSDVIHNMVSKKRLDIHTRRGCYFLLDKSAGGFVKHTVFTLPNPMGKGILTAPTIHGNLIIGPDSLETDDRESTYTTASELDKVRSEVSHNFVNPPLKSVITSFAGLRAHEAGSDFVIGECEDAEYFFDCAGIESPGLSAAPAIAVHMAELVANRLKAEANPDFVAERKGMIRTAGMSEKERNELIASDPSYGRIICRCEEISEGEIKDAIRRPVGATTIDGIKRRVRAGMGRCQGGFCSPRVIQILSEELGIPYESIRKSGEDSYMIPASDPRRSRAAVCAGPK